MRKIKKMIPVLVCFVWMISTFMTVSALESPSKVAEQDGIAASLTCNKAEYSADEQVAVTLTVKNNNPYSVKGIETEILMPEGFEIESGDLKQSAFTLNADESKEENINLVKIQDISEPEETLEPSEPEESSEPAVSPKTGDYSFTWVYASVMFLSGVALVIIGIRRHWLNRKGILGFAVCFVMTAAMLAPLAVNAEGTTKNFTVQYTILHDDEDVTIEANISYEYEKHNKCTFNGTDIYYAVGDTVEITAPEPEEGKHFESWTVVKGNVIFADANASSTTFIMPDSEVEVQAIFAIDTFTITASVDGNGRITETADVNYGDSKTFTIAPTPGYHLVDVIVDDISKGAITSYTFENVKEEHTIKATFEWGIDATNMTSDELKSVTTEAIANGTTDISVTFAPNADRLVFTPFKEAINTAAPGSINLTIDGVTKVPEFAFANYIYDEEYDAFYRDENPSTGLKTVTFGSTVTHIDRYAFCHCTYLERVTFTKNIQEIGAYAFDWCEGLTDVVFAQGGDLYAIRDYGFNRCFSLETLIIPEGVQILDRAAFYNCSSLKKLVIPISVTEAACAIIGRCNVGVYYKGTEEQWNAMANPYWALGSDGYTITFNYSDD